MIEDKVIKALALPILLSSPEFKRMLANGERTKEKLIMDILRGDKKK
ncbi:MAG: hypothetical protein V4563_17565 [Pseudomonadota bacterium]